MQYNSVIKLFEDFSTVSHITDKMHSMGFKLSKNDNVKHPHLFHHPDFKYEYGIPSNGRKVNVLNKDYEIVDKYPIDEFLDGLKKWGIDMIKTNHKHIDQKLNEKKISKKYLKGSKSDKKRMKEEIKKHSKKADDDKSAYGKWPADYEKGNTKGNKKETKKSKATKDFEKMFESNSDKALKNKLEKAKKKYPKLTLSILKQVYNRGMAAWKTGHRPGVTQNQWAMGRVNSFLTGTGKSRKVDKDLWDKVK